LGNAKIIGDLDFGSVLQVNPGLWDSDVSFSYRWMRDGTFIEGEETLNYWLSPADGGHEIKVQVTASKRGYQSQSITSESKFVNLGKFKTIPVPSIKGNFKVGSTLRAEYGDWAPVPRFIAYQWLRDDIPIEGATMSKYIPSSRDRGHRLSASINGQLSGYTQSSSISTPQVVQDGIMSSKVPRISGAAKSGQTLTAVTQPWTSGAKVIYQWLLDGKVVKKANNKTFRLTSSHKGSKISLKVTQTCPGYLEASKLSNSIKVG
jgi:hypothetical protein